MKKFGLFSPLLFCALAAILTSPQAHGDFSNYNSVLLGDRASGMGGAATALSGDASASAFYNPATLSQLHGTNFSANATLLNKYDTSFGNTGSISDSTLKLNQGDFEAIPSSASTAIGFGTFAFGVSIITPDYDTFSGDVTFAPFPNSVTLLTYTDKSLWVGANLAVNFSDKFSAGMTMYYTSRTFQSTADEQTTSGGNATFSTYSKAFTTNNVVYILGGYYKLTDRWNIGASYRPPSLQISGNGSYYQSILNTSVSNTPSTYSQTSLSSFTQVPPKFSLGVSYEIPHKFVIDFDASVYGALSYLDLGDQVAGEMISYRQITDYAIGAEYYFRDWISLRGGVFTNFSSHPEIAPTGVLQGDRIDMLGFSGNVAVRSNQTTFSVGGYFTGGQGTSTQPINQQIIVTPKSTYIYALLFGSSYTF